MAHADDQSDSFLVDELARGLSNTDVSDHEALASHLDPPDLQIRDFARFRAWWKTDIFRLGHNAVRSELRDAYSIFASIHRTRYTIAPEQIRALERWWKDFDAYLSLYFDVEDTVLFPWLAEADRVSAEALREVAQLRRQRETILDDKARLMENFLSLSQRSSATLGTILPRIHEAFHRFGQSLADFMSQTETSLVPVVDKYFTEDDKFLMEIGYVRQFYVENGPTDKLVFLTRWMDEGGMVAYWLDTNLPKSVKNQYMTWKEDYCANHVNVAEEIRVAAERMMEAKTDSKVLSSSMQDSFSPSFKFGSPSVTIDRLDDSAEYAMLAQELIQVEHGPAWLWARDVLTLGDNAARKELLELSEIICIMGRNASWASAEDPAEFSRWWEPTQNFLLDFFDGEVEILFPWLEKIDDGTSSGAQADVGKARHAGRIAETAFTKFCTLVENFIRHPTESSCREVTSALHSFVPKVSTYFADKESLLPSHIAKYYTERDKRDQDVVVCEYFFNPPRERSSLVLLLNWMDKDRRSSFIAAHLKPGPRAQLSKVQRKVLHTHDRILSDFRRKARAGGSRTSGLHSAVAINQSKDESIEEVPRSKRSFRWGLSA